MISQHALENAVVEALGGISKRGSKWRALGCLLADEGLRGGGAVAADPHNLSVRIGQLLAPKRQAPNFTTPDYNHHGVFVLSGAVADLDRDDDTFLRRVVVPQILRKRPNAPIDRQIRSVMIFRHQDSPPLEPRALIVWSKDQLAQQLSSWYAGVNVVSVAPNY